MTDSDDYHERQFNDEELATELGVDPDVIAEWRSQGIGPEYVRVNAAILYHERDVLEWIAKGRKLRINLAQRRAG